MLQVKRNVRGQQHILFFWFLEFVFNDILLKNDTTETTWPQNLILVNAALPCQMMMGDSWGRMHVSMACCMLDVQGTSLPYNGHVGHSLLWAFSLHSNGHAAVLIVLGIFPFIAMGMLDTRCSGHLFFSFKRHVAFGCSGHLFLSFEWAYGVLAVLGIFSLHEVGPVAFGHFGAFFLSCKWACRILVVLAILSLH